MEENKNVEVKAEETKVQEQANVPAPQQETEEPKKPNVFKRGLTWVKAHGKAIARGTGLVLAGVVAGAVVGALATKQGQEVSGDEESYGGDDYGWQPEPEDDETEINDDFNFDDESEEEAS